MMDHMSNDTIDTDTNHQAVVDDYFLAWNTTDPTVRSATIDAVYSPTARVCDPLVDVTGHDQLAALFDQFHATYAGASFRQKGGVDAHHQLLRWGWEMVAADGSVMLDGLDVALLDDDGKLSFVAGFFGSALPA